MNLLELSDDSGEIRATFLKVRVKISNLWLVNGILTSDNFFGFRVQNIQCEWTCFQIGKENLKKIFENII